MIGSFILKSVSDGLDDFLELYQNPLIHVKELCNCNLDLHYHSIFLFVAGAFFESVGYGCKKGKKLEATGYF